MADEILRSKHAFGTTAGIPNAIKNNLVDAFDILFLTDPDGNRLAWIDKAGNVQKLDVGMSEDAVNSAVSNAISTANAYADGKINSVEAKVESVESSIDSVDSKIESVKSSLEAYMEEKYEITDAPEGTLINYYDREIRIMCPNDVVFTKQAVGEGGDTNTYYVTFKTYAPCDEAVGYIEHLGDQVDAEILMDLKTLSNGRRYQPTWLGVAKYDETTDAWTYYGATSDKNHYIGWDYQIDWYNADGVMIASDSVRINLSNEECHYTAVPSYVSALSAEIDAKVAEVASGYEIVEF